MYNVSKSDFALNFSNWEIDKKIGFSETTSCIFLIVKHELSTGLSAHELDESKARVLQEKYNWCFPTHLILPKLRLT